MGRILVADDHDSLRRGIVRALTDAKHDVVLPLVQFFDRHVAVRRLVDLVSRVGQRAHDAPPQRIVIIGNQNASHRSSLTEQLLLTAERKRHAEDGPASRTPADVDPAVVRVDDLADDRQPEP